MIELVESSVRKHCAMWDTGATPGGFVLTPDAPLSLFPLTTQSGALELVVRYNGNGARQTYVILQETIPNAYFSIYELSDTIVARYISPLGGSSAVWAGPVALTWYHVLGLMLNDGADNIRTELYVDGIVVANSGAAIPHTPFNGGATRDWSIGSTVAGHHILADIALVRDWVGTWPTPAGLPDRAWYPPATGGLRGQWDFTPGQGNTIYDSGPNAIDMPWIAGTQANARYAHYRYTGQPTAQLWQPR